jgi:hypothetical protein
MVAKKGNVQAHHFAHHAQKDGRSCVSAGETDLHKFAKRILNERLEIALPAMVLVEQDDQEIVVQAEKRSFDRAILEAKALKAGLGRSDTRLIKDEVDDLEPFR